MFCYNCGAELPDNVKSCSKCGTKLIQDNSDKTVLQSIDEITGLADNDKTILLQNKNGITPPSDETVQMSSANANVSSNDATVHLSSGNANALTSDETVLLPNGGVNASSGDETVLLPSGNTNVSSNDATVQLSSSNANALSGDETVLLSNSGASVSPYANTVITGSSKAQVQDVNEIPKDVFGSTYRILGEIGKGGGGVVYKAFHKNLQKEVVIKKIINSGKGLDRNETDLLKNIKHTYLPSVLDFIEHDGEAYTVMDFIPGSDIDKLVKNGRRFRSKEIIKIARELCEVTSYLHGRNPAVVHSDIKPANVMLNDNGDICLIDFNVSLIFDKNASVIGGTPGFAPPEQLGIPLVDIKNGLSNTLPIGKITPVVNERSDVYSIGAFLYFLITGQNPSADYRVKPITEFGTRVPDGLLQVVATAMSLNPAVRYRSAAEMLTAVKNIGKLDKRYKALKARRIAVTFLAVVLVGAFGVLADNGRRTLAVEHEEKYLGYVSDIKDSVSEGEYKHAENIIGVASEFEPTRIEPYYIQTLIYYSQKNWEKCAAYPDSVLNVGITENMLNDLGFVAEMYEMAAESSFELENYEDAVRQYKSALGYSDKLIDCYRDMTIAYARMGEIDNAEESLKTAREHGVSSDKLELMQGEISAAKGEVNAAYESFLKAIEITDDDYIRFRALLVCDKTMLSTGSQLNAMKMIALLKEQRGKASDEYVDIISEMLANEYAAADFFQEAADIYGELLDAGTLGYSLQKNYFNILFSKLNDYGKCVELLSKMKLENPEDYWVEMNFAYVRISIENAKDQTLRDYSDAMKNFTKAEEMYSVFTKNGKSDPNMDNLRAAVNELRSYGWIKEN